MSERTLIDASANLNERMSALEAELNKLRESNREEPQWNFGIVRIKRSTDLIALVAFVLSLSTLGAQIAATYSGRSWSPFLPIKL
jgi:hypothetical protein